MMNKEISIAINLISEKEKDVKLALDHARIELEKLKGTYEEIKSNGLNSPGTEYLIKYYANLLSNK